MKKIEVPVLYSLDGKRASTHWYYGERGESWRLTDRTAATFGRRFVRPSKAIKPATRARYYRARGFTIGTVRVPARIELVDSGARIATA